MWCSTSILVLTIERCESVLKKHECSFLREDLIQLKAFLENWARIQIEEERLDNLKQLNV